MEMICTLSHQVPQEKGKFKVYTAGQVYDVPDESVNFKPLQSEITQTEPVIKTPGPKRKKYEEVNENDNN